MAVYDRSYSRWDGDRDRPVRAVPVIAAAGVRKGVTIIFRRKLFAVMLTIAAFGPFVAGLLLMYARYYVMANMADMPIAEAFDDPEFRAMTTVNAESLSFYMLRMQSVFVFMACLLVGAGLVAEDRRANALELYLARPVTVMQYVLGKFGAIGFFIALVTVVPASLAILAQMSLSAAEPGELARLSELMLRAWGAGAVLVMVPSLLVLAASSLALKARNAAIGWVAFMFLLEGPITNIPQEIFNDDRFFLLSFFHNVGRVCDAILGHDAITTDVSVWQCAAVLAGWCVLCLMTIRRRVRPVEVVA